MLCSSMCVTGGRWRLLIFFLLLPCLSFKVYSESSADDQEQLLVVASIEPLALMAKMLLPEGAAVKTLVPAGADPHHYALKVSDRQALAEADLVLWVGPDMERFLARMIEQLPSANVISLEDAVGDQRSGFGEQDHILDKHDHSEQDLHLWLNPMNAIVLLKQASERLGVQVSMVSVTQQLTALDTRVRNQLMSHRTMTYGVYHDAYRHFSEHYGLPNPVVVAPGIDQRPGARHLYRLRQELMQAACLLVEANQRNSLTQQLHDATAVPLVTIKPLEGQTYSDLIEGVAASFKGCATAKT